MSTSNGSILLPEVDTPGRTDLRLRMAEHPGTGYLDGGWWPHSLDLAVELVNLVEHLPPRSGRIVRAWVSRPDWDPAPRRIPAVRGDVCVGSLLRDDTHLIVLETADRTTLRVLVVPPDFTRDQGEEALLASATAGNAHSATDVLEEVTDQPDAEPRDRWTDDGASWWGSDRVAPSFRTGGGSWPT